jgi:N-sulfoglucosamine sulfohydrolase
VKSRLLFGLVIILGPAVLICPLASAAERNIVLIVTDDQSPDFGAYGNAAMQTPNLDALAADATVFRNAFCTTASCSASRSVILTGLHNHANGHYGHEHAYHKFSSYAGVASLPRLLAAGGYRTARCGKFHVAPPEVFAFEKTIGFGGGGRNTVAMAKACREFLSENSPKPFFLYWCTTDPHRSGRDRNELPHAPNAFGNEREYPGCQTVTFDPDQVLVPGFLPDTPECRAELAQYYESVARIDQGIGQLVAELKRAGVWDTTLLVFISDHGIAFPGAKTTLYEGGMHSPLVVRNPYRNDRGNQQTSMVSWVDLTPTLLDFAGALDRETGKALPKIVEQLVAPTPEGRRNGGTQPGEFHGRSFLELLDGKPRDQWQQVFASHTFHEIQMYYPMRVVRESRFKLIWNIAHPLPFPFASDLWVAPTWQAQYAKGPTAPYGQQTVASYLHRPEFELFDLASDPYEGRNLASDPSHAETLARLKTKLRQFQRDTRDPWILKWEYE